jgi:hypothetical protein
MFVDPTWWELAVVVVVAAILGVAGHFGLPLRVPCAMSALYRSERRAILTVGLISLAVAVLCSAIRPQPPSVHDEFSYLLAADTFAHGRLTNSTHPLWRHFETFHVLQHPTRQSKYPPAQGIFLAIGQVLSGRPIVGVWLSLALACIALYWCLRSLMPRRWAFFAGLLPCFRFGQGPYYANYDWAYWATTYWGGAAALLGSCLVLGSAIRLMRGSTARSTACLLGLGLPILAASRPLEGLALATPVSLILVVALLRRGGLMLLLQRLVPTIVVATILLSALGYYNWRVTDSPLTMPYQAYTRTYDVAPIFRFQEFRAEPEFRHDVMRRYHLGFQVDLAGLQRRGLGIEFQDVRVLASFLLGRPLAAAALLGVLFWRSRWAAFILLLLAAGCFAHALTLIHAFRPHYFAPFVPLVLLLAMRGVRVISTWDWGGRRVGAPIAQGIVIAAVGVFVGSATLRARLPQDSLEPFAFERQAMVDQLEAYEGGQLVIVRYEPSHGIFKEWVYNRADIDGAKVVWAREMGEEENIELLTYFNNRTAWLLEPDANPPRLTRYVSISAQLDQ